MAKRYVTSAGNQINVDLAPLSVNTIVLKGLNTALKTELEKTGFKATIFPNPATDQVHLDFSIPEKSSVNIDLYNAGGQLVKTLGNGIFDIGNHQVDVDLQRLFVGVYWIKIKSLNDIQTLKIIKN